MVASVTRPRSILLAAFALFAWVAATFANGWHERVVTHMVCAEHGEVVDVGQASAGSPGASKHPGVAMLDSAEGASHHDGCSLPGVFPVVAVQSFPAFDLAGFVSVPYDALAAADARVSGPLLYAPKTSPPRA